MRTIFDEVSVVNNYLPVSDIITTSTRYLLDAQHERCFAVNFHIQRAQITGRHLREHDRVQHALLYRVVQQ